MLRKLLHIVAILSMAACGGDYLEDFPVPTASTVAKIQVQLGNDGFAPAEVQFQNESIIPEEAGDYSVQWFFGDGQTSTEENPVHTYNRAGRFEVRLLITTERGLVETKQTIVIKNALASGRRLYFFDRNSESMYLSLINDEDPVNIAVGTPVSRAYSIAVDSINNLLYFADFSNGIIYKSALDGSERAEFRTGLAGPAGVSLDLEDGYIFWTTDDGVQRANLNNDDPTQYQTLIDGIATDPEGLTLDTENNRIWIVTYDGGLWQMNYDGGGASELIPEVLGAAIKYYNGKIYYHSYDLANSMHTLKVSDANGSNTSTLGSGMDGDIYGLDIDAEEEKIYWNDQRRGTIMRSNLDGSLKETWFQDESMRIYAVAIGGRTE